MASSTLSFPFRRHALALALALATGNVHAATINVSNDCTLVNAINNANSDADTDGAGGCPTGSGADILELTASDSYTLTAVDNTTNGPNGLPAISSTITINGNEATIDRSGLAGTPYFRLFFVTATGNLSINQLTLTGGKLAQNFSGYASQGGCIFNDGGSLNVNRSAISGNSAFDAGAILNQRNSDLTLTDSIISGNNAIQGTGVIRNNSGNPGGSATLTNSVISGNSGSDSLYNGNYSYMTLTNSSISNNTGTFINLGFLSIDNSTISNNDSGISNVGIYYSGVITMTNSTFSGNNGGIKNVHGRITLTNNTVSGNSAQGIFNKAEKTSFGGNSASYGGSVITLTNTLVANNSGGDCYMADILGTATILQGVNLIKDGSCAAPVSGDPKLGLLLDNGGPTMTQVLKAASIAIDAADSTRCPASDQRAIKRPKASLNACDIGAFEKMKKQAIPANVLDVVQFFDTQASSGGIKGVGAGDQARQLRDAVRNQLVAAGHYKDLNQACMQLTRTLTRIDIDNTPDSDDYLTGNEAGALANEVTNLRTNWTCS